MRQYLRYLPALLIALFAGVALFVSMQQSVWLDESLSIYFSHQTVGTIIHIAEVGDLHPPLYNLFLHVSGLILGSHIFTYRLWSVLFYTAAAIVFWFYIKNVVNPENNRTALYLFFFLSSPFALYYASESRSYMLVILLALIRFVSFDRLFSQTGRQRNNLTVYTVSSIVAIYTFYPFLFSLIGEFLYVVILKRELFKKLFWSWCIITLSYAPWIYLVLLKRLGEEPGHFLAIPWWQIPAIILAGFSGGRVAVTDLNHTHQYWPTILITLANLLGLSGVYWWIKNKTQLDIFKRILTTALIPVFICLVISAFRFSIFDPRYYAEIFPLYLIVLCFATEKLYIHKSTIFKPVAICLIVANLLFLSLYVGDPWYQREPWKQATAELEAEVKPNDAVVFIASEPAAPAYNLYQTKPVKIVATYDQTIDPENYPAIESHLQTELKGVNRVWFSQFLEWQKDPDHHIRKMIEKDFVYVKTIGFFKVQFDLYERKK